MVFQPVANQAVIRKWKPSYIASVGVFELDLGEVFMNAFFDDLEGGIIKDTMNGRAIEQELLNRQGTSMPFKRGSFEPTDKGGELGAVEAFLDAILPVGKAGKPIHDIADTLGSGDGKGVQDGACLRDDVCAATGMAIVEAYPVPSFFGVV